MTAHTECHPMPVSPIIQRRQLHKCNALKPCYPWLTIHCWMQTAMLAHPSAHGSAPPAVLNHPHRLAAMQEERSSRVLCRLVARRLSHQPLLVGEGHLGMRTRAGAP